jgi:LPXTG-motif cell wall-anchored protein
VRFQSVPLVVLSALIALAVLDPQAQAASERHRSGPHVRVNHHVVRSHQEVVVRARSSVTCGWILTWPGHRKQRLGHVLVARFRAPSVTHVKKLRVRATCLGTKGGYGDSHRGRPRLAPRSTSAGPTRDRQAVAATVPRRWQRVVVITVLPLRGVGPDSAHSGDHDPTSGSGPGNLPDTGGPPLWLLVLGLLSTLIGALLLRRTRAPATTSTGGSGELPAPVWFSSGMSDPSTPSNPYGEPPNPSGQPPVYGQPPAYGRPPAYGQQPYFQDQAPPDPDADKRPGTVTAACVLTLIFSGLTLALDVLAMIGLMVQRDSFLEELDNEPGLEDVDPDQLFAVMMVTLAVFAIWALVAMILAVLALRRSNFARILLVISAVVTSLFSLLAIMSAISAATLIAGISVVVMLLSGSARDWYARKNAPPQAQMPMGTTQPWG